MDGSSETDKGRVLLLKKVKRSKKDLKETERERDRKRDVRWRWPLTPADGPRTFRRLCVVKILFRTEPGSNSGEGHH